MTVTVRPLHYVPQKTPTSNNETVWLIQNEEEPVLRDKQSTWTGKSKITHSSPGLCLDETTNW